MGVTSRMLRTFESLAPELGNCLTELGRRPGLLYGDDDLVRARRRLKECPELERRIREEADRTLSAPDFLAIPTEPYYSLRKLHCLTEAQMAEPQPAYAGAMLELLHAFVAAPSWVCHVHRGMRSDHCAANTAAAVALSLEALGPALPVEDERAIAARTSELCFAPFLDACERRSEFWAKREHRFNWRIMTCGDSGLAALSLAAEPDRLSLVRYALEGVADILDRLPAEGDWEEGPGYWAATLFFGLRFGLALRRLTGGRVDLLAHPALRATAEYFVHVTLPDGSVFNYADNSPTISGTPLHLLARLLGHGPLAWTARKIGIQSFWDLLFEDPTLPTPPEMPTARIFPSSGIAVARSDWSDRALYVGFKSGPTAVGHSHLDIQSFILSKGRTPLVVDPGVWPYGSFLGFFDTSGPRWQFDANATIAHNTIIVDGRGQNFGPDCRGEFIASELEGPLTYFVSDGTALYRDRLDHFDRWVVFVRPDVVLVYDDLAAPAPHHWEWLLHHAGTFSGGLSGHRIENGGVCLRMTRLLPDHKTPWRISEETRTSYYQDSNGLCEVERRIHLRRFGPMFPSPRIEFLWVLQVGSGEGSEWRVERAGSDLRVVGAVAGRPVRVTIEPGMHRSRLELL